MFETDTGAGEKIARLAGLVAEANERRRGKYIYTFEYYGGRWIWVKRRGYVIAVVLDADVVRRDTRTTAAGLDAAIAAMERELRA